jgi:cytochrome c-type biogenesis protein CcmH/NrfG
MRRLTILAVVGLCCLAMARGAELVRAAPAAPPQQTVPGPSDLAARIEALSRQLGVRPLSSSDWLALAGMRVAAGAPEDAVASELRMSYLTGPNEAPVMFRRGVFGLLQWQSLPETVRADTIRDLAGVLDEATATDARLDVIKGVIAAKPADARSQIAAMLGSEQVPAARLVRIGL